MRSVEVFASSWNMGGVDRECCFPPGAANTVSSFASLSSAATNGGIGGGRSALQLVMPLWIPKGYDLYVRGPGPTPSIRACSHKWISHQVLTIHPTPTPTQHAHAHPLFR